MMTRARKTAPRSETSFQRKHSQFASRPFAQRAEEREKPVGESRVSFSLADIDIFPRETVQPMLKHAVQRAEVQSMGQVAKAKDEAKPNRTGMSDRLKSGLENLSGMDLSGVRVHYNSKKPAHLNAFAYTQGQVIEVGPGQERHLPHEAWHVVQQAQGRVPPTIQVKGMGVNDEDGLEAEADIMGIEAEKLKPVLKSSRAIFPIQQHIIKSQTIQLDAAADLAAAQQNQLYLVNETANLNIAGNAVYAAINGALPSSIKDNAANGLRNYWQTVIDGFDGKKAEMYEAELLYRKGHIPILSTNDRVDPDVRTETGGNVEATEVKTINSDNTGNVNTLIKGADNQLGKRVADVKKIKIRIESAANLWPDARYNNIRHIKSNEDLKNLLTNPGFIPHLENANEIQIEGINIPYEANSRRNFWAEVKGDGCVKKTSSAVWR